MPRPKGVSRKEWNKNHLEKENTKQKKHLDEALFDKFVTQPEVIAAFMNATIDKIQDINTKISKIEKRADITKDAIWDCYLDVQCLSAKSKLSILSLVIAVISLIVSGVTLYLKLS